MKLPIESETIMEMLPHRYPFLLVDRVTELDPGKSARGIKNVTVNEPYFQGHFQKEKIVPGVLIVESLAQLTAVMYCACYLSEDKGGDVPTDLSSKVGYLVDIRNMKFHHVVKPGDTMQLHVMKKLQAGSLMQIRGEVFVDRQCVAEGSFSVSERP